MNLEQLPDDLWNPSTVTHTGSSTWTPTCTHMLALSLLLISLYHNAKSNNRIKLLCFGLDDGISISANLAWLIHSGNPVCWLCDLRWLPAILATYHHTRINRNIFSNYRNAAVVGTVNYFDVCQNINRLTEPFVVPYSKTQKPAIDFSWGRILSILSLPSTPGWRVGLLIFIKAVFCH